MPRIIAETQLVQPLEMPSENATCCDNCVLALLITSVSQTLGPNTIATLTSNDYLWRLTQRTLLWNLFRARSRKTRQLPIQSIHIGGTPRGTCRQAFALTVPVHLESLSSKDLES